MPGAELTTPPSPRSSSGGWPGWSGALAALVALGLGSVAAVMMVAGHPPWEGPTVLGLTETHGIHEGDALALVPFLAGVGLAWWCWTRPRPQG